ncbi:MAG: ribonuclease HI family protein [Planctomycetes bacterium]|nr:ribonuclease HI family protein [Planctomycetota bacterium]
MTGSSETFTLFTDGGSRGNPGPAAAGFVLADGQGRAVHAAGHFLGRATNNVAEYRALVLGLEEALRRGVTRLVVRSDSELMVRQLQGAYRVRNEALKPLFDEALAKLNRFESAEVVHVRRHQNTRADGLVNEALDRRANVGDAAGGAVPSWPPDRFTAHCTADAFEACPAVVSAGGRWTFDGATPPGLCVHAAAGILAAVHGARPGTMRIKARCLKPGCTAAFGVRVETRA